MHVGLTPLVGIGAKIAVDAGVGKGIHVGSGVRVGAKVGWGCYLSIRSCPGGVLSGGSGVPSDAQIPCRTRSYRFLEGQPKPIRIHWVLKAVGGVYEPDMSPQMNPT